MKTVLSILIVLALATGFWLVARPRPQPASPLQGTGPPTLRAKPLTISFKNPLPDAVPEKTLQRALIHMEPYWEYRRAPDMLHALRLWGTHAAFPAQGPFPTPPRVVPPSSREFLGFFLEQGIYRKDYVEPASLFLESPRGLGVRHGDGPSMLRHVDDLLELAGEVGLSADTEFHADSKTFTLNHLFTHSFAWFHAENELEFTACAYALYLPPGSTWQNRFGDQFNFDQLAEGLLASKAVRSTCYATHIPYALAILLAADEQEPILSPAVRQDIEARLRAYSKELVESQSAAGSWDRHWTAEETARDAIEDQEMERVRSTGHHLEWMALVKPELRPPEKTITMAIKFVLDFLTHLNPGHHSQSLFFNPCSHAARALVLFSGHQFASEIMQEVWSKRSGKDHVPAASAKGQIPEGRLP